MAETFELICDDSDRLALRRPEKDDVKEIRLRRAFPWSGPDKFVSIRTSEGKELLLIEDLATVQPAQRTLIERWLATHAFIPRILRIKEIDTNFGYQLWSVETDRGPAEFRVQEREDLRFLSDGRFSVKDADGTLYEIPSLEALDQQSQRAIEALV